MTYLELIEDLIKDNYLKTPEIIEAFRKIDRADFLTEEFKNQAGLNSPFPIGFGQTISQPLTVVFILELLEPKAGDKILDIGSGSGWQAAILAYIVGKNCLNSKIKIKKPEHSNKFECSAEHSAECGVLWPELQSKNKKCGKIFSIERIQGLAEFAEQNITKYNFIEKGIVEIKCADGSFGWPNPPIGGFDKIIAAASGEEIPQAWKKQLKVNGRMVVPIKESIWLLVKESEEKFREEEYPGFAFVPLIIENK